MKLIVGLGNPGEKYENTRHNAGFWVVDKLASQLDLVLKKSKFKGATAKGVLGSCQVLLVKPDTFMNLSGECVSMVVKFYGIDPADIIVVQDDIDMVEGKIRVKSGGGSGGHNGIKSLLNCLGTEAFQRVKVGVGRPPEDSREDVSSWVLKQLGKEVRERFNLEVVPDAVEKIKEIIG